MNDLLLHQSAKPDRRTGIIGEDQKRTSVWDQSLVQRHTIHCRSHAMFARAIMHIAAAKSAGINTGPTFGLRVVGGGQIG